MGMYLCMYVCVCVCIRSSRTTQIEMWYTSAKIVLLADILLYLWTLNMQPLELFNKSLKNLSFILIWICWFTIFFSSLGPINYGTLLSVLICVIQRLLINWQLITLPHVNVGNTEINRAHFLPIRSIQNIGKMAKII